jgi:hypothetical protein
MRAVQSAILKLAPLGDSGCAFLTAVQSVLGNLSLDDVLGAYDESLKSGFISKEGYIKNWEALLSFYAKRPVHVLKVEKEAIHLDDLKALITKYGPPFRIFGRYVNNSKEHFVELDARLGVIGNTLEVSECVNKGTLVGLRYAYC